MKRWFLYLMILYNAKYLALIVILNVLGHLIKENMSNTLKRRDSSGSDVSTSSRIPVSFTPTLPRKQRSSLSRNPSLVSLIYSYT